MNNTSISWTDLTWNPVAGCTKVSPACEHCYAETIAHRFAGKPAFPNGFAVTLHPERLEQPLRTRKPSRIFTVSMGDLFHEDVPFEFIWQVQRIFALAPQHTYQILTKRPERAKAFSEWVTALALSEDQDRATYRLVQPYAFAPNVWLGVTAENQEMADRRIPLLLQVPAAVRFVSCEPMLGPVDLRPYMAGQYQTDRIDAAYWAFSRQANAKPPSMVVPEAYAIRNGHGLNWVIAGGESGPHARPSHPDWFRSLRDECQAAGVPYFLKQWGEWVAPRDFSFAAGMPDLGACQRHEFADGAEVYRVGRKAAGDLLDGREWHEFPEVR